MNALQAMIEKRLTTLETQTSNLTAELTNLNAATLYLAGFQAQVTKDRNILIAAGVEGKNAEERAANLAVHQAEQIEKIAGLEADIDRLKTTVEIAYLYHQTARYALQAAMAISEARDK